MKRHLLYIIALLSLLSTACRHKHYTEVLTEAARLSDTIPSEALIKLQEIKNVKKMSDADQAAYNLIFVKSMIRSRNKLTSDSVIHITTQYYLEQNDSTNLYQSLRHNAIYHYQNDAHDSAIYYFNKAIAAIPAGKDTGKKAGYKRNIGSSYLQLKDTQAAVDSQKEGLEYALAANDSLSVIYSLLNLADAYKHNKEMEQSFCTYNEALEWIRERGDRDMEADILHIVSGVYESENRIKEALYYKNKAQEVKRNRKDIPAINLQRAVLFSKLNMSDSARHYAQLSIKGDDSYVAELAYSFLSIWETKMGHYTDALNLSKSSEGLFNFFYTGIYAGDMQQKYEKEKLKNENNQLKIKQKEHLFYLVVSGFLLLLLLILLYIIRVNSKRKNEKIAHENRMFRLQQENMLLKQRQEISALREKEAILRESLFKRINFFHKLPSLNREENSPHDVQGKIKITGEDWKELENSIQETYPDFLQKLREEVPTLSDDDLRFCCLLKINVNMQDLSDIYCVSKAAITKRKYRLKTEKFRIEDSNLNLDTVLQQIN